MDSNPEEVKTPDTASEPTNPPKDAEIRVIIKNNNMQACVNIAPPQNGGKAPTAEALANALRGDVTSGINYVKLRMLVLQPTYNEDVVVASGADAVSGTDGRFVIKVGTANRGKPREADTGKVDYYDLGLIENVEKGQLLAEIIPPTEGTAGYSVKGVVLKQRPGRPAQYVLGLNTELSADGLRVTSKINGHFEYDGRKISVNDTFTLKQDVDTSTGNLKSLGNLIIIGAVTNGFKVEAAGFITVSDVVDSATVISGLDLNLKGGAIGATINCSGNLKSRFIENCDVFVRGEFRAEYIVGSTVRGKRSLKTEGSLSKIIGGTSIVMQNIETSAIGSPSGVRTQLEIGSDPELVERQHALSVLIPEIEKQKNSLEPLLKLLHQLRDSGRLDADKAETLTKASNTHDSYVRQLENARKELEEVNTALMNKNYGKVICTGTIYPGTSVKIGAALYAVTQNLTNVSLSYQDGYIAVGPAR